MGAKKEEGIAKRFEAKLDILSEGLSRPRTTKRVDKLWEHIWRLKEKSHGVNQHYQVESILAEDGKMATFRRTDERTLHVRKASKAEPNQLRIYNALGINPAPGGVNKLIV